MEVLGADKYGDYQVLDWKNVPLPRSNDLLPNDVLILVAFSDVNPVDLQKLQGGRQNGQPVKNPPFVPGFGGSGTVLEVGSQVPTEFRGKQACFLADPSRQGSYATHICVDCKAGEETFLLLSIYSC
jgi:NADPH:quinone reductase-like Zn-dependent oxidoreductase